MIDQNIALWIFSLTLLAYLTWLQAVAPFLAWHRNGRGSVDPEQAGKMLFDYLRKSSEFVSDELASNKSKGHPLPYSGAVKAYLADGINKGIILAKGHEEHLDEYQDVPRGVRVKDGLMFCELRSLKEDLAAIPDGTDVHLIGLQFKQRSIEEYIRYLERDRLNRERAKALEQKSS